MVFKRYADMKADNLLETVQQEREASRQLVARVLRAQRLQQAVVRAAIHQFTKGQEALQA